MIEESAEAVATSIALALASALPGTSVMVYPAEPETAAAPCVWLTFTERAYVTGQGWQITLEASVVADAALGAITAQRQLAQMTDAVCDMECAGVLTVDLVARGGGLTTRIGEVPHPVHLVTIPHLTQVC